MSIVDGEIYVVSMLREKRQKTSRFQTAAVTVKWSEHAPHRASAGGEQGRQGSGSGGGNRLPRHPRLPSGLTEGSLCAAWAPGTRSLHAALAGGKQVKTILPSPPLINPRP